MALTACWTRAGRERKTTSQWRSPTSPPNSNAKPNNPNPCVGNRPCCRRTSARACGSSGSQPGERIGFHRHVLDYFWTSVTGGRGRQHVHDGTTVEYTYQPGETRHETYGKGEFKVHDLQNLGDNGMIFMTVEFKDSANKPLVSAGGRPPHKRRPDCRHSQAKAPASEPSRRSGQRFICRAQLLYPHHQ